MGFWQTGVASLLVGAAAVMAASPARADEPRDLNTPVRVALLSAGAGVLLLSYGYPCAKAGGRWCVPVAGPFLQIAHLRREEQRSTGDEDGVIPPIFVYTLLAEEGLVQFFGVSCLLAAAIVPRKEAKPKERAVRLLPMIGPAAVGVGAVGTF